MTTYQYQGRTVSKEEYYRLMGMEMDDPFDRLPTKDELDARTKEDYELERELKDAERQYKKEHPEYVP